MRSLSLTHPKRSGLKRFSRAQSETVFSKLPRKRQGQLSLRCAIQGFFP
jgi:hypothetical protein